MGRAERSSRLLLWGAVVSVTAHAALMLGFVRISDLRSREGAAVVQAPKELSERELEHSAPDEPEPEIVVRLGIEQSDAAATMTWLGFAEPTEHEAPAANIEQSGLTLSEGSETDERPAPSPGVALPPPPIAATVPPAAAPHAEVAQEPAVEASPEPEHPQLEQEATERQAAEQREAVRQAVAELGERLANVIEDLAAARPAAAQAEAREEEPRTPVMPPPPPPAATGGAGEPGIKADRESIATAIRKATVMRPGQVVAAEGLEIQTRRPRWTTTTMLTRRPRNPTVLITFARSGEVLRVEFANDGKRVYDTGYEDVDQPLLNAIYYWTAKGKPLLALPADRPEASVTVMLTILLS